MYIVPERKLRQVFLQASLESIRQKLSKAEDALREERLRCELRVTRVKDFGN